MKLIPRLLAAGLLLLLIASLWLWWHRPKRIDMAGYAPADSLVFLESNSLVDVAESITNNDAWKAVSPFLETRESAWTHPWLRWLSAWTGIGPIQSVIFCRSQLAVVILDLGTSEEGETLKVKPQAAILIETHTSEGRISSTVEQILGQFAQASYQQPTFRRTTTDGMQLIEWTAPTGSRQIVATINGSLVIVGNSESAVKSCLAVKLGQRPSLRDEPDMRQMRVRLGADNALAFGYVSSANAARLLALAAPLLFGRAPGDLHFEQIVAAGAVRVLGSIGWSSHSVKGGIEDSYLFSLKPAVVSRLQPLFRTANTTDRFLKFLPDRVHSLTVYKYADPPAAWQGMASAVTSQLDTLSAVVFTSLVRSALLPYGIEEPEKFLRAASPELVTLRLDARAERAVLIAGIQDENTLRQVASKATGPATLRERIGEVEIMEAADKRSAAGFVDGYLLLGSPVDIRRCLEARTQATGSEDWNLISRLVPLSSSANVITYTDDRERVNNFLSLITRSGYATPRDMNGLTNVLTKLPYSATETHLDDQGLARTTRSSFGQFSSLLPLLFPS